MSTRRSSDGSRAVRCAARVEDAEAIRIGSFSRQIENALAHRASRRRMCGSSPHDRRLAASAPASVRFRTDRGACAPSRRAGVAPVAAGPGAGPRHCVELSPLGSGAPCRASFARTGVRGRASLPPFRVPFLRTGVRGRTALLPLQPPVQIADTIEDAPAHFQVHRPFPRHAIALERAAAQRDVSRRRFRVQQVVLVRHVAPPVGSSPLKDPPREGQTAHGRCRPRRRRGRDCQVVRHRCRELSLAPPGRGPDVDIRTLRCGGLPACMCAVPWGAAACR